MHPSLLVSLSLALASAAPQRAWAGDNASAPVVDADAAGLLTELVTTSLGKERRFEVLSSADVRRQLEIEANRAVLGCDANASASCLAEIAGAMGAQLVVYGKLGALDDVVILTLNLFDSQNAKAAGRVAIRENSLAAMSDRVEGAVAELIGPYVGALPADARAKLLVLDLEAPHAKPAETGAAAPAGEPLSGMALAGIGGLIGGAVVVVAGGALLGLAAAADARGDGGVDGREGVELSLADAKAAYDERDLLGSLGVAVGAAGVVIAGASGAVYAFSE